MIDRESFDDAFREWATRAPVTSAPDAARAVVSRVWSVPPRRLSPAWATVGIAAVAIVAAATSFVRSLAPVTHTPSVIAPSAASVPARDADVVLWLDDRTPVYVFLPDGK